MLVAMELMDMPVTMEMAFDAEDGQQARRENAAERAEFSRGGCGLRCCAHVSRLRACRVIRRGSGSSPRSGEALKPRVDHLACDFKYSS
jgi:hypothetical protein